MKTAMLVLGAFAAFASVAATNRTVKVKNLADCSREEREAVLKRHLQRMGGTIYRQPVGSVAIIVVRDAIPTNDIPEYAMAAKRRVLEIPFAVFSESSAFSLADASAKLAKTGSNAGVFVVDDPTLPMTVVAQEAKWGVVNVAPLKADGPDAAKLAGRVDKTFTRVCVALLGGLTDDSGFSAMHPVFSLKDIDEAGRFIAPAQLTPMSRYIDALGIKFGRMCTYKQACMQGWAPTPTNEYQKAIWEKVHAIPTKPLKITHDKDHEKPVVK